ncbi:solute carrier family 2, facilitated glucose transporter member 1 [Erpetoichthys calabaricus]|uniref:solute carrier family 2, facilitated glucose transporter member 1 n=1 Tax=Erpetoichthys calabaricus TaxID=27687 RepID=UPI00109FC0F7|nr:solute carrier family 2, facilitated glucose transporter member 1 [Erpetoichthys calabaricus]
MCIKQSLFTLPLVTCIMAAVLGSLQVGYHSGNINSPEKIIEIFFNETWKMRYNRSLSEPSFSLLWSVTISIKDFGGMIGALGVKVFADTYGRRNSILVANGISILSTCLMSLSHLCKSFELLILGRLIFGLFCGLIMSLNPLYIQEISPRSMRGACATVNQALYSIGILLGMLMSLDTVLGTDDYWPLMLSLSLIPAFLQYLCLPFCPESPRYLIINQGKVEEAKKVLQTLRGPLRDTSSEITEIQDEAINIQSKVTVKAFLTRRSYRMPILILIVINLAVHMSGFNIIVNYSTSIFRASGLPHSQSLTLGVGAINTFFTIVSASLMERAGRRKLLLVGFAVKILCNVLLTITTSLSTIPGMPIVQVVAVFGLVSAFELGPGPISWFISAELFDQAARPFAMSLNSLLNWGGKFLSALLYTPLLMVIGPYVYTIYAGILIAAFVFAFLHLPETKGRTFDEISSEFRKADGILLDVKNGFKTFQ